MGKINTILYIPALILFVTPTIFCCCSQKDNPEPKESKWLVLAKKSENYLQKAKYSTADGGQAWKVMPDSLEISPDNTLYSGTAGVVLFYLELYNATKDSTYLNEAVKGSNHLLRSLNDSVFGLSGAGLYTGLAGTGFTLTETYKNTREKRYAKAALKTVNLLEKMAMVSKNGIHWDSIPDIIYGSAGIGLYLHYIAKELDYDKADQLAIKAADGVLDLADKSPNGLRWKFRPNHRYYMDNFSHGTSGVAYFLAETYKRTKDKKYLDAAIKSTRLLDSISNDKGYIPHHLPGGEGLYYLNWCHGPAGTSRLYYNLYRITGDSNWMDKIKKPADNLLKEGIEKRQTPGYWNNVGRCCGTASLGDYYLSLFHITGDNKYWEFAEKLTQNILDRATYEENQIKWIHAENRLNPNELAAQTGLMQGSAGIGLWFLKLNAQQLDTITSIRIPDEPKIGG
ncbi:hypothetical protein FK220_003810 [Flavobacteriaceae bacterium TP-CH-4]|uniref:Lanthionine synthetase C-like protein n=1 Tax=Pelagihabitans pacificus TaxID=2696054 RepID=A0A967AQQ8_9FLAO|nr:lanthionine synthetase LanC family protein [Pelagihabitans pacificus]NHF58449.1 hypothetical protein [Pelagihabitans pacificus]